MSDKNELFKIKEKKAFPKWIVPAVLIILIIAVLAVEMKKNDAAETEEPIEELSEEEYITQFVGPADCDDRGEWVEPCDYYGITDEDGAVIVNDYSAMFSKAALKGIVPCGLRLSAAMLTYDDFLPYSGGLGEYDLFSAYSCNTAPEITEIQLGIDGQMSISGSYEIEKDGNRYSASIQLELRDIYYYLVNEFDIDEVMAAEDPDSVDSGLYGYLNPNFGFCYTGSYKASISGNESGFAKASLEGRLTDAQWKFTTNLSGQGNDYFPNGEIYIRCKLPCVIEKDTDGKKENTDSFVNLYLKLNEVRIGTRADCMPDWLLQ